MKSIVLGCLLLCSSCSCEYPVYSIDSQDGQYAAFIIRRVRSAGDEDQPYVVGIMDFRETAKNIPAGVRGKRIDLVRTGYVAVCDLHWEGRKVVVSVIGKEAAYVPIFKHPEVSVEFETISGFKWCADYLKSL